MNMHPFLMKHLLPFLLVGLFSGNTLAVELKTNEWYLQLIVSNTADNLRDDSNMLGQLKSAVNGYDPHDLVELAPFAAPYLTLVFPHPEWEEKAGDYGTDFHQRNGVRQVWYFEVRTDDVARNITLHWALTSNTRKVRNMWLVDGITGKVLRANSSNPRRPTVSEYSFNMDGETSYPFYWVQGSRRQARGQPNTSVEATPVEEASAVKTTTTATDTRLSTEQQTP